MATTLTRSTIRLISADIQEALKSIADKYDVEIVYKGASFTESNATMKLAINTIGEDGSSITKENADFARFAYFYGLQKDDQGKSFVSNGDTYTIRGIKSKSRKYPILCERSDGKMFKFPASSVRMALGRKIV